MAADYHDGKAPVAPSAVAISSGKVISPKVWKPLDYPVPRALETEEVPDITRQAVEGAKNAIKAGDLRPPFQHSWSLSVTHL